MLGALGWVVVALVLGEAVRHYRAYLAEVADRAARAERSRVEETRRQLAEERVRIARDVHDVLAHSLAAIHMQAGVAAHLLTERPAPDRQTLAALAESLRGISQTSRAGVAELRATLDVLRGDDPPASRPSLARLPELVESIRAAGTDVEVRFTGEPGELPDRLDAAAFRIAQEALTNAVKHAHSGHILVRVGYGKEAVRVTVSDDGDGAGPGAADGGHGIAGMRERAHSAGGRLTAGVRPGGGFEVDAVLPRPDPS